MNEQLKNKVKTELAAGYGLSHETVSALVEGHKGQHVESGQNVGSINWGMITSILEAILKDLGPFLGGKTP